MKFSPTTNKSSTIEGVHFDPATGTMTVQFKSGHTYHYAGCKQSHHDELCAAESPGRWLHKNIKGQFAHRKADSKKAA